jgi:hypothetical protein
VQHVGLRVARVLGLGRVGGQRAVPWWVGMRRTVVAVHLVGWLQGVLFTGGGMRCGMVGYV